MAKILTQRSVDSAKPRPERFGIPCGLVPGLQLTVQASGFKSFSLFARIHGKQVKLSVGKAGVLTLAQARDQARQLLVRIARGEDPRAKRQAQPAPETVAVIVARFVERHVKANRSWRAVERTLTRDVLSRWSGRAIISITKSDVVSLLDAILDRDAPVQANRTLAAVKKLLNWCVERGYLEHSAAEKIKMPSREVARDRTPSDDELVRIWAAADALGYPFGLVVQLLILTGARRSEVSDMRWSEIDATLTWWTLPKERTKNGKQHALPLSSAARKILESVPRFDGCDFVFTANGVGSVKGFVRAKKRLDAVIGPGMAPWVLHDLRRAFASGAAALDIQQPVVEKILNHTGGSFSGVSGIYQRHTYAAQMAQALEIWGAHITALVEKSEHRRSSLTAA
jgi:integrase